MIFDLMNNGRVLKLTNYNNYEYEQLKIDFTLHEYIFRRKKRIRIEKSWFEMGTYLPSGFWLKCLKLQQKNYPVLINGIDEISDNSVTLDGITEWVQNNEYKASWLVPRWYQTKALYYCMKYRLSRGDFATGAGKTFICYLVSRYILEKELHKKGKKVLMVVPSVQLVKQTYDDWMNDYQSDDFISIDVRSGTYPELANPSGNVIIGNIDYLNNLPREFFDDVTAVIFDEAHKLTTDTYGKIFSYLCNRKLDLVYSVSGSWYEDGTIEDFDCEAISGPILLRVTAKQLMDEGSLTPVKINEIPLEWDRKTSEVYYNHPDCQVTEFKNIRNHFELSYIRSLRPRMEFIASMVQKIEHNQLLLFKSVEYLEAYEAYLKEICTDKQVLKIIGDVKGKDRDKIKVLTENNYNVIICATYGTMSTGVSINNLSTLHFVEPPKSFIWVRQSIGRTLRLHKDKKFALILSYPDVFKKFDPTWLGGYKNITHGHLKDRIKIYEHQKFEYKILNNIKITNIINTT